MKKHTIYYTLITTILFLLAACDNLSSDVDSSDDDTSQDYSQIFLDQTQIGVYLNDGAIKLYDELSEQIVYNDSKTLFVVSNMEYTTHYTLSFSKDLLLDSTITTTITTSGVENLSGMSSDLTVVKIETSDKRYWLWDSELQLGFIVDFDI